MNFKKDKPELFDMMGEYYKLTQEVYELMDIREILAKCDAFLTRWAVGRSVRDRCMAEGLVQGILEWKNEELKEGK